jgi:pyruvate-ferredoxin/flavodoxin oxidoreductase
MKSETVKMVPMDGCEAAAHIAYRCAEVIAIYPITPSSPMSESTDVWATKGITNVLGDVPRIVEMQSEGGAAGALHGALLAGALTTTFTSSQGLLLMIPNMYKIAGELTPTVIHVAARSLASASLSIFGDHADVMAARATGFAILFSNSVQEAMDLALVSHSASLDSRVPFMHAFDGFRTSHEIQKVAVVPDTVVRKLIKDQSVNDHRSRALNPDRPSLRGSAANPDTYFQSREAANPWYNALPAIVQTAMDQFAAETGRAYHLFDYEGHPEAEEVIVIMGSGAETAAEAARFLNAKHGRRTGVLKVRLFRPFSVEHFLGALPVTTKAIAVLDRTKEPGCAGEPLYQDILTALVESQSTGTLPFKAFPRVISGRYGLSSKEFSPSMVKSIFDELSKAQPKNHFTIGIYDDVTHTSLPWDKTLTTEDAETTRAIFWGLGSDGTVGANKNTIKIIGENTPLNCQGYFVYDSKKAGAFTVSHLRFGPNPIRSPYLVEDANFIAVHQFPFIEKFDVLERAAKGSVFLLNAPLDQEFVWDRLPKETQKTIIEKQIKLYVIDAYKVARENNLGPRINTVMQTCFFALSNVLPLNDAIKMIKDAIKKTYGKRGTSVVERNCAAVDATLANLHEITPPAAATADFGLTSPVPATAPEFLQKVTAPMLAGQGDELPVSALPPDGIWPTSTTRWEKRRVSLDAPRWISDLCIQCGKCVMVCPHSVIRGKVFSPDDAAKAPASFLHMEGKFKNAPGQRFTIQVSTEDCTGCTLCVEVCPGVDKKNPEIRALNMHGIDETMDEDRKNWDFFLNLPDGIGVEPATTKEASSKMTLKDAMLRQPTFEFSSACSGCGETGYLRTLSQLFGDRAVIANATGCSSIYGGNLPTTPWSIDKNGRGPAWANSLFEDNAEFGLGMRLALDHQAVLALRVINSLRDKLPEALVDEIIANHENTTEAGVIAQQARVKEVKKLLTDLGPDIRAKDLLQVVDTLVRRTVWIIGGDGWAYDIGYGGLDHVIATGADVNILVLDTEVYSNTGGQASKSTPLGSTAKFATAGKGTFKKDLGLLAMSYQNVYVAQISLGANDTHTLRVLQEAESFRGPSIIMAYSPCVAHGIDLSRNVDQSKLAVASGHWLLYRYMPAADLRSMGVLKLDSKAPSVTLGDYHKHEGRFRVLQDAAPEIAAEYLERAQNAVLSRRKRFEALAGFSKTEHPDEK